MYVLTAYHYHSLTTIGILLHAIGKGWSYAKPISASQYKHPRLTLYIGLIRSGTPLRRASDSLSCAGDVVPALAEECIVNMRAASILPGFAYTVILLVTPYAQIAPRKTMRKTTCPGHV